MLKVLVVGYDKMLNALISGAIFQGHKVVGALRYDRVNYSKFTLFLRDFMNQSKDLSILKNYGICDIKAQSVNSQEFIDEVNKLKPDVILVGSWGEKIKKEVYELPKLGTINCHPSLLPKNRGANPYYWTLRYGEKQTGVTFHRVDENYDTGEILLQEAVSINTLDNIATLKEKCCNCAYSLVGTLLDGIENNTLKGYKQDENQASYEYQFKFGDMIIDFELNKNEIHNRIRALKPVYPAYFKYNSKFCVIKNYKFFELNDKYKDKKNGDIIYQNNKIVILKAADCLVELEI